MVALAIPACSLPQIVLLAALGGDDLAAGEGQSALRLLPGFQLVGGRVTLVATQVYVLRLGSFAAGPRQRKDILALISVLLRSQRRLVHLHSDRFVLTHRVVLNVLLGSLVARLIGLSIDLNRHCLPVASILVGLMLLLWLLFLLHTQAHLLSFIEGLTSIRHRVLALVGLTALLHHRLRLLHHRLGLLLGQLVRIGVHFRLDSLELLHLPLSWLCLLGLHLHVLHFMLLVLLALSHSH